MKYNHSFFSILLKFLIQNNNNMIRFSKVRDVKTPVRGTNLSGGLDFFTPNFTDEEIKESNLGSYIHPEFINTFLLKPNQGITIPTGIKMNLADFRINSFQLDDYDEPGVKFSIILLIDNKSGIAARKGLLVGANTVDEDYQGEIHMNVINVGSTEQTIRFDEKLVQGKFEFVILPELVLVDESELFDEVTERGTGGFGSTGVK